MRQATSFSRGMLSAVAAIILFSVIIVGCKKDDSLNVWKPDIKENKYASIAEAFASTTKEELLSTIKSQNEYSAKRVVRQLANDIASYYYYKLKIDISEDFINNPEGIILLGCFRAKKEQETMPLVAVQSSSLDKKVSAKAEDMMACFITTVGTVIGISEGKALWKAITAGATEESAIAALKLIGKRVAGAITVVIMVYEVGECLGWW